MACQQTLFSLCIYFPIFSPIRHKLNVSRYYNPIQGPFCFWLILFAEHNKQSKLQGFSVVPRHGLEKWGEPIISSAQKSYILQAKKNIGLLAWSIFSLFQLFISAPSFYYLITYALWKDLLLRKNVSLFEICTRLLLFHNFEW